MINDSDIETTAKAIFSAQTANDTGRTTYLRTLIEAVQEQLGKRGQDMKAQLVALKAQHQRFYAVVMRVAEDYVPVGTKHRKTELHRRATFARTATTSLRGHIRAGGDAMTLKAVTATKAALRVRAGPQAAPSLKRLATNAKGQSNRVLTMLEALAKADKPAAIAETQALLGALTAQLLKLGVASTQDALVSTAEHRPLKVGKQIFIPTNGQKPELRTN
jgi:hypothetical protein